MPAGNDPKRIAGFAAVDRYIRDGMCVGLGTGTTAFWAIERVGERVAAGERIVAVGSSVQTEALCTERNIPVLSLMEREMDVAIDGPAALDARLRAINGVLASGLFTGLTSEVIVAGANGVRSLAAAPA